MKLNSKLSGAINIAAMTLAVATFTSSAVEKEAPKNKGDRPGHVMEDVIPKDEVPPAPILTVKQAVNSMQLQPGFVLENVVSEPNVFNPITMVFDGDGRMWICEMTRYMPDTFGSGEHVPEGNIVILEDTTGDGKVDKRTVFLNDIVLPRTISMVKGGIFYADHTQLYFTEIIEENGRIRPGIREVVDPTYAEGGSLEHKTNTMMYGMDNWYYNAKSNKKYQTLPLDAKAPKGTEVIYKNAYWQLIRGKSDYRGQWGLTMDDFGRLFHNNNSEPAQGEFLMPGSLLKNPGFWGKTKTDAIGNNHVYSARMNTGINRGYLDGMLIKEGEHRGKLKSFTAASGSVIYRGDNFPEKFYGMAVTPEPAANLISARHVIEKNGTFSGRPVYPKSEILASSDERFRPVNLYTAPDGTIYILDMYHGILQHKAFLTTYLSDQIEARELDKNNNTMGRIYRLRWQENEAGPQPKLNKLSSHQLIHYLSHDNGWWRDTARRLIIEHNDKSVAPRIRTYLLSEHNPAKTVNALWALHGISAIDLPTLDVLLNSKSEKVIAAAIAVSSQLPIEDHHSFAQKLLPLATVSYEVSLQIALVAGALQSDVALAAAKLSLDTFIDLPQMREAVVSGLGTRSQAFLKANGGSYPDQGFMYLMTNLGKRLQDKTSRGQLSKKGQQFYDQGKKLYNGRGACFGCHAVDGNGIKGMGPTFWQSEWVVKDPEILAKVMLHGLMGDIWLKGYLWQTSMVMPGMNNRADFSDEDLAAIATYIRNSWGNASDIGSHVQSELFQKVRNETKDRAKPYTQEDVYQ